MHNSAVTSQMSPSKLPVALQAACAAVLGEPVQRVELIPLYDSHLSGPSPQCFHAACDKLRTPSLTLLVNDAQTYAVGGYTTVPWGSQQHAFLPDPHSFLFHLRGSPQGYASFLHPPFDHTASIFCGASFGPVFGRGEQLCNLLVCYVCNL